MDDPAYAKNAGSKLSLYAANGIIPSVHLITTYETKAYPLNAGMIEHLISYYSPDPRRAKLKEMTVEERSTDSDRGIQKIVGNQMLNHAGV